MNFGGADQNCSTHGLFDKRRRRTQTHVLRRTTVDGLCRTNFVRIFDLYLFVPHHRWRRFDHFFGFFDQFSINFIDFCAAFDQFFVDFSDEPVLRENDDVLDPNVIKLFTAVIYECS